jgi:Type IV secretory pathway, VirB2 components (pilins)
MSRSTRRSVTHLAPAITSALLLSLAANPALAAATGAPWETPIQNLVDSLTGPIAQGVGIIAIVMTGLGFAIAESGGVMRRALGIVFGLALAFAAATWGLTFLGFAGGAVI